MIIWSLFYLFQCIFFIIIFTVIYAVVIVIRCISKRNIISQFLIFICVFLSQSILSEKRQSKLKPLTLKAPEGWLGCCSVLWVNLPSTKNCRPVEIGLYMWGFRLIVRRISWIVRKFNFFGKYTLGNNI